MQMKRVTSCEIFAHNSLRTEQSRAEQSGTVSLVSWLTARCIGRFAPPLLAMAEIQMGIRLFKSLFVCFLFPFALGFPLFVTCLSNALSLVILHIVVLLGAAFLFYS